MHGWIADHRHKISFSVILPLFLSGLLLCNACFVLYLGSGRLGLFVVFVFRNIKGAIGILYKSRCALYSIKRARWAI